MKKKLKETIQLMIGTTDVGILFDKYNIYYCIDQWITNGCIIFTQHKTYVIVGSLEYDYINDHNIYPELTIVKSDDIYQSISDIIASYKPVKVFTESCDNLRTFKLYSSIPSAVWISDSLGKILSLNRQTKTQQETMCIVTACRMAEEALRKITSFIEPDKGISEIQIARQLERIITDLGYTKSDCDIMVHSGPNTSYIHSPCTDRFIEKGDLILIDLGVKVDGYNSDVTRMYSVGPVPSDVKEVYDVVSKIHDFICDNITSMNPFELSTEVDKIVNQSSKDIGLNLSIDHALGHGIGLEVHESPTIGAQQIRDEMTLAIEPGFYIKNKFGVRLENDVHIVDGRCMYIGTLKDDIIVL